MSGLLVHNHGDLQGWRSIDMPPLTEMVSACPCCQHTLEVVYEVSDKHHHIPVVCCDDCGYVGYGQLPEALWLDNYYAGEWMAGEDLTPAPNHPMADILVQIIPKNCKVLEIGCGKGACLSSLRNKGYQHLAGVEQCEHRAQASAAHTGLEINSDWPEGQWDVVASFHVLEHFRDPHVFFQKALERQTKNGCILLVVPRAEWEPILGQLLFILHLHSFTTTALECLANAYGYKKVIDASNVTDVVQLYIRDDNVKPKSLSGGFVKKMQDKIDQGLCLSESATKKNLRWRVFDTYATFNPIDDPHRSICVSSAQENEIRFESDQCLFVK